MADPRLRQLVEDLRSDREDLDRILHEGARCLQDLSDREPSYLEIRGAGDIVHDYYNVIEHFFERVATEINGGLPSGADSHAQLLRRMARGVDGVRPAIINDGLRETLHEYLRFRHLFRHGYGFAMVWTHLAPLLAQMQSVAPDLCAQLDDFVATVMALSDRLD